MLTATSEFAFNGLVEVSQVLGAGSRRVEIGSRQADPSHTFEALSHGYDWPTCSSDAFIASRLPREAIRRLKMQGIPGATMMSFPLVRADEAPLLARPFFAGGDPGPLVGAFAHVPELLAPAMSLIGTVYGPTALPTRLKEIVVLRTSVKNGCRYCTDAHMAAAADAGLSPAELCALRAEVPLPESFAPSERAAIAFAEALCDRPDSALGKLGAHFEDHLIVELTALVSVTIFLNRFCTALGLPTAAETRQRVRELGFA